MNDNVKITVEGSKLVIEVDLTHEIGPSTSGKNMLVAKCREGLPGRFHGTTVQVNCYRPIKAGA